MIQHSFAPLALRSSLGFALGVPLALWLTSSTPSAQVTPPDLSVLAVEVNQAIQSGTTTLVAGKSTMVRAPIKTLGTVLGGSVVDALMHVLVNGVEIAGSPIYSDNGPLALPLSPSPADENASLNFIFIPPQASNVVLQIELNPVGPNQLLESNYGNNLFSTSPLTFVCRGSAEIVYVPIDYRPNGGTVPNLPDLAMIAPGIGDNFTQGIYPTPDWNYHRSVAPSKLWTESLSGTGSGLLSSLAVDINLMVPKPDFIYGWVPGPLPGYNGQAISIPGNAAMGNTELVRFQRTMAHELGHLFGLQHNSTTVNLVGVDVEDHLHLTQNMPTVLPSTQKDIMYAGLLTVEAWVAAASYNHFMNSATLACGQTAAPAAGAKDALLVAGVWNRVANTLELRDTLVFSSGQTTAGVPLEDSDLVLRAWSKGVLVSELPLVVRSSADDCGECRPADSPDAVLPDASFAAVMPTGLASDGVDLLTVTERRSGLKLAELKQSAAAPAISFLSPKPGENLGGLFDVQWQGSDADGDSLRYYLRYSPDGTRSIPLATGLTVSSFEVNSDELPALQPGKGYFELLASDGLNTSSIRTESLAPSTQEFGPGNAPWTYVLTPDEGLTYKKAGTVILRCNVWDLEDLVIDGPSVVWTSNLDGQIGTGRHTSVATLSVGTHVLTVTATDSSGAVSTDTTTITITDRPLPGAGQLVCQADLGFGGPGTATLSMCGGNLSTGTSADFKLQGAPPSTLMFLPISSFNNPTPLVGGLVVPVPIELLGYGLTDGNGNFTLPLISGGGGPATLYVQAVYVDAVQAQGYGFSNALQIEILP